MRIIYDSEVFNNTVKRNLVNANDNLSSTISECGNISIPYGFSYSDFLNSLSDKLSQVNNNVLDLINWINNCEATYSQTIQALDIRIKLINNNVLPKATTIIQS